MSVTLVSDQINDDYAKLLENVVLYGTGIMLMSYIDGQLQSRIVPIEEYAELGEHLKHVQQTTVNLP